MRQNVFRFLFFFFLNDISRFLDIWVYWLGPCNAFILWVVFLSFIFSGLGGSFAAGMFRLIHWLKGEDDDESLNGEEYTRVA